MINRNKLEEGLLVCGINPHTNEAVLIRVGVHSVFNHNAMVVKKNGVWCIAEAVSPVSKLTTIEDYEKIIGNGYIVRFYRIKNMNVAEREYAARYFIDKLIGLEYPKKRRMILLAMPIYNAIVDRTGWLPSMRLNWCSQLCKRAYEKANAECLKGLNGKAKELFTPRTFEKRILTGIFEDVTDTILC